MYVVLSLINKTKIIYGLSNKNNMVKVVDIFFETRCLILYLSYHINIISYVSLLFYFNKKHV